MHAGTHNPRLPNGGYAHIFAPRIDMRETSLAYHIDIELPGVHSVSDRTIAWRSTRELLVEGAVERPSIVDVLDSSHNEKAMPSMKSVHSGSHGFYDLETGAYQVSTTDLSQMGKPADEIADGANGVEQNGRLYPTDTEHSKGPSQANPFVSEDFSNQLERMTEDRQADLFPLDIIDGKQLDEGDIHRVQVPTHHHYQAGEARARDGGKLDSSQASVTIAERDTGRFMRCFVFPGRVDVAGLRSSLEDGLLRIGVTKAKAAIEEQDNGFQLKGFE